VLSFPKALAEYSFVDSLDLVQRLLFIIHATRINRPGGTGRITNIHCADKEALHSSSVVIGLDVKYTINSGHDLNLDPELVSPHVELETRGRRRAPAVVPIVASENDPPKSTNRESKSSKMVTKRHVHVASKNGSASKAKVSLPRKIGFPVRRKSLQAAIKSATSPNCATSKPAIASSIPLEIVFSAATVSNTPTSGCSKSATDLRNFSPLGEEGVESHLLTTASYDRMIQPLRPSVGTTNAHCPLASKNGTNAMRQGNDMDFDIVELRISPCTESDKTMPECCINVKPLASGSFSNDHQKFEEYAKYSLPDERKEKCEKVNAKQLPKNNEVVDRGKVNESAAMRANPTLRDVYDNEVKIASKFVGTVVHGQINVKSDESIHNRRLNRFRSLLNDFLSDSDGMIESENLAHSLRKFAQSSFDDVFDYTEHDVEEFVSELCAQNKIMQTEGWIYNI
jgi:hypothetical protein